MRILILLCQILVCGIAQANQTTQNESDYYKLLTNPPQRSLGPSTQTSNLNSLLLRAWPDRGERGYIASRYVRSAEERRAFIRALKRVVQTSLSAADDPVSTGEDYLPSIFSTSEDSRSPQPLAFHALLLSTDGEFSEEDIWQLIRMRLRNAASFEVFADIAYLFDEGDTEWTPEARAIFNLASGESPTALGIQRLLARYQHEAVNSVSQNTGMAMRLALPIHGLYDDDTENMLALIEGQHLWRDQGRADLVQLAKSKLNRLADGLAARLGQNISADVTRALGAPVRYSPVAQALESALYWPEGAQSELREWQGVASAPASLRWVRMNSQGEIGKLASNTSFTRRVGSNDQRWWPASQEAYLDLAYRGLPELLRAQLAREGVLEVFRVWHAGAEDGSQTFLLAALLDEALEMLVSDPKSVKFLEELKNLRIEIIATDYAYMPSRRELTYRFDVSGQIGDLHHKWNLVPDENPAERQTKVTAMASGGANADPLSVEFLPSTSSVYSLASVETKRERALRWRSLADDGRVGELLGRLLALAPEVDVPSGRWLRDQQHTVAKHRYSFINQDWRIVELDGEAESVVNPGTSGRLMRFEKGDMTRSLPFGFEEGNAFDLSVVTGVLPYIYGYYRQQGEASVNRNAGEDIRLTPMEAAQELLQKGARDGGWIIVDQATEEAALQAGRRSHALDANYGSWTDAWKRWVGSVLPKRDIKLYLTREFGIERVDRARYESAVSDG